MRGRARFVAAALLRATVRGVRAWCCPQGCRSEGRGSQGRALPSTTRRRTFRHRLSRCRGQVLRHLPQRAHEDRRLDAGHDRPVQRSGRRRRVGESGAQGQGRDDAAARGAASGPGHGARAGVVPHDRTGSRLALEAESRTRPDSPSESGGICQRDPRSLLARRRHVIDAAARRCRLWIRQHCRRAWHVAGAARALPDGGRQDHVAGGWRS